MPPPQPRVPKSFRRQKRRHRTRRARTRRAAGARAARCGCRAGCPRTWRRMVHLPLTRPPPSICFKMLPQQTFAAKSGLQACKRNSAQTLTITCVLPPPPPTTTATTTIPSHPRKSLLFARCSLSIRCACMGMRRVTGRAKKPLTETRRTEKWRFAATDGLECRRCSSTSRRRSRRSSPAPWRRSPPAATCCHVRGGLVRRC